MPSNVVFVNVRALSTDPIAGGASVSVPYRQAILITSYGTDFPEGRCDAIGIHWTGASGGSLTSIAAGSQVRNSDGTTAVVAFAAITGFSQATSPTDMVVAVGLNRIGTPTMTGCELYALYI